MAVQSVTAIVSDGKVYSTVTVSFGTPASSSVLGESSLMPVGDGGNAGLLIAQRATLAQPGTLQSLSFYVTVAGGKLRLGLYDVSGPSGGPGKLVVAAPEITTAVGWNTVNVAATLAAGAYWLAYTPSSDVLGFLNSQTGSAKWYSFPYGALPDTFSPSPSGAGNVHWSFYATVIQPTVIPVPFYTGPFNVNSQPTGSILVADLVRSVTSHPSGSWYFEMTVNAASNAAQVGVGLDNNVESLTGGAGRGGSIVWRGNGEIDYNGTASVYSAPPFVVGNVLGVDTNIDAGTIRFRVNGGAFVGPFSIAAITGTPLYAMAELKNIGDQITANFTGSFAFTPPSTAWG